MKLQLLLLLIDAAVSIPVLNGNQTQSVDEGNCRSHRITFDPLRMYASSGPNDPFVGESTFPSYYDLIVDYGHSRIAHANHSIALSAEWNQQEATGLGAKLSTSRYAKYAKISVKLQAAAVP
ncbi:hypothetical protein HDU91_001336, partial [Kappamyces sp. JEL0680]